MKNAKKELNNYIELQQARLVIDKLSKKINLTEEQFTALLESNLSKREFYIFRQQYIYQKPLKKIAEDVGLSYGYCRQQARNVTEKINIILENDEYFLRRENGR